MKGVKFRVKLISYLFGIVVLIWLFFIVTLSSYSKPNSNNSLVLYQNYKLSTIPCFVISTIKRHTVTTNGCNTVLVSENQINIADITLEREFKGQFNERSYLSDYLSILNLLVFGIPEESISAPAPNGFLLIEDDVLLCEQIFPVISSCSKRHLNCKLGFGATANFFSGINSHLIQQGIYKEYLLSKNVHVDWYLGEMKLFDESYKFVNHLSDMSVLNHKNGDLFSCPMNQTSVIPPHIHSVFHIGLIPKH